jgi:hypothetical protein
MKRILILLAMVSLGTLCWAGSAREDATERLENATNVCELVKLRRGLQIYVGHSLPPAGRTRSDPQ